MEYTSILRGAFLLPQIREEDYEMRIKLIYKFGNIAYIRAFLPKPFTFKDMNLSKTDLHGDWVPYFEICAE